MDIPITCLLKSVSESQGEVEHLFVFCEHSRAFWKEISSWLHECGIETLPDLTDQINIMFGLFDVDNHFMLLNFFYFFIFLM